MTTVTVSLTTELMIYDHKTKTFSAFASDLQIPNGTKVLSLVSHRTGQSKQFQFHSMLADREGDPIEFLWVSQEGYKIQVFNT